MNEEEIEIRISVHERTMEITKERIADLKAQLAEAEPPKPEHGDYGVNNEDQGRLATRLYDNAEPRKYNSHGLIGDGDKDITWLGNIFKDLEAIRKPLKQFNTDVHTYAYNFKDFPHAPIYIAGTWHTIPEAEEHILKLRRLVVSAKAAIAEAGGKE